MSSELVNRSKPVRGKRRVLAFVPLAAFITYVIWSHLAWGMSSDIFFLSIFFGFVAVMITYFCLCGVFWKSFTHLPPAAGRVLCIVPIYNEDPVLVKAVIDGLLRQSILPDQIHVVDDGSAVPMDPIVHPLIKWDYTPNGGKRHAQAHALRQYSPNEFDYIMTVDSDSVCDDDALEHLLRSMKDDRVQAATGMIFVRNWNTNLLTRFTDINVVTSVLLFRMARSWFGIVSPTSGALALYRAAVVYDNLEDYVTSGTAGDDRRLSFYALLRGHVVGVNESVVSTELPDSWRGCFLQRMRWSKSAWLGTGFVVTNLRPLMIFFYCMPLVFALAWPMVMTILITLFVRYGNPVFLQGVLWWEICAVTQTAIYAIYRPVMSVKQKLAQWLLSPIYPILGLLILRPAAYWSLTKLKSTSWHTRETPQSKVTKIPEGASL